MEKDSKNSYKEDIIEDTTKYGEYLASYFGWNTLEGQKKKAQELEKITNHISEKNVKK